jgi:hypothetical protein
MRIPETITEAHGRRIKRAFRIFTWLLSAEREGPRQRIE